MRIGRHIVILSDTQTIAMFVTGMIGAAVVAYVLVSASVMSHGARLDTRIRAEESALTARAAYYRARERLSADRAMTARFFGAAAADEKAVLGAFLRDVETLAKKERLAVLDISPKDKPKELDGIGRSYQLTFATEGPTESVLAFLADIDAADTLIAFEVFSLTAKDESGARTRLDGTLSLTVIDPAS